MLLRSTRTTAVHFSRQHPCSPPPLQHPLISGPPPPPPLPPFQPTPPPLLSPPSDSPGPPPPIEAATSDNEDRSSDSEQAQVRLVDQMMLDAAKSGRKREVERQLVNSGADINSRDNR